MLILFGILILNGCYYGVNKTTSEIGPLSTLCIEDDAWNIILKKYSTDNVKDSILLDGLNDFDNQSFGSKIIYFSTYPIELIGIDEDYYSVRYVFNPHLSNRVLDGFSSKLTESEKNRILDRVQNVIIPFQCEEGKKESYDLIENRN